MSRQRSSTERAPKSWDVRANRSHSVTKDAVGLSKQWNFSLLQETRPMPKAIVHYVSPLALLLLQHIVQPPFFLQADFSLLMCVHVCACVYVCMCVHVYVCTCVYVFMCAGFF